MRDYRVVGLPRSGTNALATALRRSTPPGLEVDDEAKHLLPTLEELRDPHTHVVSIRRHALSWYPSFRDWKSHPEWDATDRLGIRYQGGHPINHRRFRSHLRRWVSCYTFLEDHDSPLLHTFTLHDLLHEPTTLEDLPHVTTWTPPDGYAAPGDPKGWEDRDPLTWTNLYDPDALETFVHDYATPTLLERLEDLGVHLHDHLEELREP